MKFIVHPYMGIEVFSKGLVKFGSHRENVKKYFNEKPEEFLKSKSSSLTTDAFPESSIHVFYDELYGAEAFEFNSNAVLMFQDKNIFAMCDSKEIKSFFAKFGSNAELEDSCTMNFKEFGISIYFNDSIEGAMVYSEKYLRENFI